MAQAMGRPKKATKRDRQRAAAEARAALKRRQAQRRALGYGLGGTALVAIVVLAVFALMAGDDGGAGVEPSAPGTVTAAAGERTEPLAPGEPVPEFSAPAIGGGTLAWSDYAGEPAVVAVWAPWCSFCQAELPVLDRVMAEYPDVAFVTVVTAIGQSPGPDAAAFLEDNEITAPTAIDDGAGTLAGAFGIRGFPTLYFVDSDGNVVRQTEGATEEDTLREIVSALR
jgi:thiol-disulfide isomerase/thioredoxin